MIDALKAFISVVGTIEALGIVIVLFAFVFLVAAHRGVSAINFAHTLQDADNRTSLRKFGEWVALLSSTWVLVYLTKNGDLTEGFFTAYLFAWVLRAAIGPLIGAKADAMASAARVEPGEPR